MENCKWVCFALAFASGQQSAVSRQQSASAPAGMADR
jgi:hypothetical protein